MFLLNMFQSRWIIQLFSPNFQGSVRSVGVQGRLGILIGVFLFMLPPILNADTIFFKDGRTLDGIIKKENSDYVELDLGRGKAKFQKEQIDHIGYASAENNAKMKKQWSTLEQKREQTPAQSQMDQNKKTVKTLDTIIQKRKSSRSAQIKVQKVKSSYENGENSPKPPPQEYVPPSPQNGY